MRKFLVIGCGGSGGATQRFMMDQLKADLSARGVQTLPTAWQFLHLDVPVTPDRGPGLLGSVPDQGGTYRSLTFPGARYSDIAAQVDAQFMTSGAANGLASWRPEPTKVTFPIVNGAGQYRAVGRVLTLARARSEILPALQQAWTRLQAADVLREMTDLARRHPELGLGAVEAGAAPVVLIISSVAGGSGASMVLDVARLLSMVEGVDPGLIGMFLYLPEAFEGLEPGARPGVEANGAGALAELIAAQAQSESGQTQADATAQFASDAFRAMGLVGMSQRKSFARVFPLGRSIGASGAIIGDGQPMTIFRALGRGLAALMVAGNATEELVNYDFVNTEVSAKTEQFGWGVEASALAWGSFGYASLSLGRDRYAEYAAQRLARTSVDALALGHRQAGDQRPDLEQVRALVDQRFDLALGRLELPAAGRPVHIWFEDVALTGLELTSTSNKVAADSIHPLIRPEQAGKNIDQWVDSVRAEIARRRPEVQQQIDGSVESWAIRWQQDLVRRVESEVTSSLSLLGLPYTIRLLERLRERSNATAGELRTAVSGAAPRNPVELPQAVRAKIDSWQRVKGVLANPNALGDELRVGYVTSVGDAYRIRAAAKGALVLAAMDEGLLKPLEEACRRALVDVERARQSKAADVGLAQVRTDQYAAWPADSDASVPQRFANAENEVLLTTTTEYPDRFRQHVRAESPAATEADARQLCSRTIISGEWETVAGDKAPGGLVERLAHWRPAELPVDAQGNPVLASRARYSIHVATQDVLGRARMFVSRPGQPFATYTMESLRQFLADTELLDSERHSRERLVTDKFRQALQLATPVVGVSPSVVEHLHGRPVYRRYKFGLIPFHQLPVASLLEEVLTDGAEMIETTTSGRYVGALVETSPATRIDIFGSYELYLPLAFTSFLTPIAARWASRPAFGRHDFWQWRRARPLPEALPMGVDQRRAMVAGWLLGEITGMVKVPDDFCAPGADPAQIWDEANASWMPLLPNPGLVGRDAFHVRSDFLTAILESMVIAIANSHDSRTQEPLLAYTALRRLYDKGETPTRGGMDQPQAAVHLARWIRTGQSRSGRSILGQVDALTAEERQESAQKWLAGLRDTVALRDNAASRALLPTRPRILDLADDVKWACDQLIGFIRNPPDLAELLAATPELPQTGGGSFL